MISCNQKKKTNNKCFCLNKSFLGDVFKKIFFGGWFCLYIGAVNTIIFVCVISIVFGILIDSGRSLKFWNVKLASFKFNFYLFYFFFIMSKMGLKYITFTIRTECTRAAHTQKFLFIIYKHLSVHFKLAFCVYNRKLREFSK